MCVDKLLDNHKTHWQWYKDFFNVTVLRYLVTWFAIVPIAASFIANFKPHIKFKDLFEVDFLADASLPLGLKILWLSSLFFVIALLLYQWLCPGFIKTYSSFGDYKHHQHSSRWIIWEALKVINDKDELPKLFERLNEKKFVTKLTTPILKNDVIVVENQTVAHFLYNNESYSIALPIMNTSNVIDEALTANAEKEIFWEIFGRFSSSKKYWRLTIIVLLVISALLFGFTLVEHIWIGLKYFI